MRTFIILALIFVALGLRHTHKSQYDMGYEAGVQATHELTDQILQDGCGVTRAQLMGDYLNFIDQYT